MEPRTFPCDLRGFVACVQLPTINSKQKVAGARDFTDSFASSLRITIFQPFLSSRLSRGTGERARLLSPEPPRCRRAGLSCPSLPATRSGLGQAPRGEGSRKGPSHPAGEMAMRGKREHQVEVTPSTCSPSLCPLAPSPPAEASPPPRVLLDGGDGGTAVPERLCRAERTRSLGWAEWARDHKPALPGVPGGAERRRCGETPAAASRRGQAPILPDPELVSSATGPPLHR